MIKSTRAIVLAMVMSFAAVACAPSGGQGSPPRPAVPAGNARPAPRPGRGATSTRTPPGTRATDPPTRGAGGLYPEHCGPHGGTISRRTREQVGGGARPVHGSVSRAGKVVQAGACVRQAMTRYSVPPKDPVGGAILLVLSVLVVTLACCMQVRNEQQVLVPGPARFPRRPRPATKRVSGPAAFFSLTTATSVRHSGL